MQQDSHLGKQGGFSILKNRKIKQVTSCHLMSHYVHDNIKSRIRVEGKGKLL